MIRFNNDARMVDCWLQGREDHHDLYTHVLNRGGKGVNIPWTICRGERKVAYTENIYPPVTRAQDSLTHYEYRIYASMVAGVL